MRGPTYVRTGLEYQIGAPLKRRTMDIRSLVEFVSRPPKVIIPDFSACAISRSNSFVLTKAKFFPENLSLSGNGQAKGVAEVISARVTSGSRFTRRVFSFITFT